MLEKKTLAEKLKEHKKMIRLQKQQENEQKQISEKIKKEKIDNQENIGDNKQRKLRKKKI